MIDQSTPDLHDLAQKLDLLLERTAGTEPRFLTIDAAAVYTGLSQGSIRRLLASRQLTPLRPVRGRIVIDRLELDSYVLGCTARPRSGRGKR